MIKISPPDLHDTQREVINCPLREIVLICGRRWGKTRLGIVKAIFGAPHHRGALAGARIWWIAPTFAVATTAWRIAKQVAAQLPGYTPREADRCIQFTTSGGELWFKSADRPDNLRGEGLDGLVIDEADFVEPRKTAHVGELYHEILKPALLDRKGWALIISTPNLENSWLHKLFKEEHPERRSFHFTTYDNPFIPKAELDGLKETVSEIAFRREILAEWVTGHGAYVKPEWVRRISCLPSKEAAQAEKYMAVDLAVSEKSSADYTAIVVVARTPLAWYVIDAHRFRASFVDILSKIISIAKAHEPEVVAIEEVQSQAWVVQELKRITSLPVKGVKPIKDKVRRFEPIAGRYEQGLIYHLDSLPPEFENEVLAFPESLHDDFVDALSYAIDASGGGEKLRFYEWASLV
ncbi:MAG: hypothetical protein C4321_10555 [Chloroflexota bacterium]